jgi:sortase (surface protein transpeptidase)
MAAHRVSARPAAPPARVEIPAIGVSSALVRLALGPDGTLQAPADYGTVGWYTGGPSPGEAGPAVIAGHLDSDTGPAVFYKLGSLRPGEAVLVVLADGKRLRFVVTGVARYAKDRFPTRAVYGPTSYPALRLITCGGSFDRSSGRYRDNLVVSARLAGL